VRGFDENFKAKARNNSSNNSDCLYFSLEPSVTSIVFHSEYKVNADCQFEAAEYRQVNNIGISLSHIIAVLNLRDQYVNVDSE
jgi:phosphate-selective porin